ncbi:hypothetical protein [Natrinema longum]|uniref:Uncharacterized protein n=1 Tax=Natrinema longum TaxID=370324 RepID=A0A8A2UBH8_9EURY|nr:hypothetical protein [Natrinema longum]MBZ6496024.1 hypothetical protein [Natrinema longum]QSW86046.1 hypothetical protein J0X27_04220 [Natrinema longum]
METGILNKPPEGVLAGESVPRENEESEYERMKRERVEALKSVDNTENNDL